MNPEKKYRKMNNTIYVYVLDDISIIYIPMSKINKFYYRSILNTHYNIDVIIEESIIELHQNQNLNSCMYNGNVYHIEYNNGKKYNMKIDLLPSVIIPHNIIFVNPDEKDERYSVCLGTKN